MSKKSDRERRERIEQEKSQRMQKFSSTLNEYLKDFAQYYRQDVPNEAAILIYQMGLQHLNEVQLKAAVQESIQKCKFFPSVAEMLECLKEWQERQPIPGTAVHYPEPKISPAEQKQEQKLWNDLMASISIAKEPMAGMRYTIEDDFEDRLEFGPRRENGWRPREESIRREIHRKGSMGKKPHFHVVNGRIAPMREPGED